MNYEELMGPIRPVMVRPGLTRNQLRDYWDALLDRADSGGALPAPESDAVAEAVTLAAYWET